MPNYYKKRKIYTGAADEFGSVPRDYQTVREEKMPSEDHELYSEYNEKLPADVDSLNAKETKRHSSLKDILLKPALSITMVLTVTLAAFGFDFLGFDYLNSGLTTMNIHWLENHEDQWGERQEHWDEPHDPHRDEPYEDYPDDNPDNREEDSFPNLRNLDPDYAGNYAWGDLGSEVYLRMTFTEGDNSFGLYFVKGEAWQSIDPDVETVDSYGGAWYDSSSNTLTLDNVHYDVLDTNLMGNSFTVRLIGESEIGMVSIWGAGYAGSVTFEGDGILRITQEGIRINAEGSQSCIIVKSGVTLEINSYNEGEGALFIDSTTMKKAIYTSSDLNIRDINGNLCKIETMTEEGDGSAIYYHRVLTSDGEPATFIYISAH